jgi:hypothetical protein
MPDSNENIVEIMDIPTIEEILEKYSFIEYPSISR